MQHCYLVSPLPLWIFSFCLHWCKVVGSSTLRLVSSSTLRIVSSSAQRIVHYNFYSLFFSLLVAIFLDDVVVVFVVAAGFVISALVFVARAAVDCWVLLFSLLFSLPLLFDFLFVVVVVALLLLLFAVDSCCCEVGSSESHTCLRWCKVVVSLGLVGSSDRRLKFLLVFFFVACFFVSWCCCCCCYCCCCLLWCRCQ